MNKLCSSELRTDPNGAHFQFTGNQGNQMDINIEAIRQLAAILAARSDKRVGSLDAEGSRAYQQLVDILKRYQSYQKPYQEIYTAVSEEFAGVVVVTPGTVGETFLGCIRSTGCGGNECNPACINSILRRPEDLRRPCGVNSYLIDEKSQLSRQNSVPNSSSAVIYVHHKGKMTNKHQQELKTAGISSVTMYRIEEDGSCSAMHNGQVTPIGQAVGSTRKKGCLWGCNGDNVDGGASNSISGWWWLIIGIIVVVIIVIIIIAIVWAVAAMARNANKNPDSCGAISRQCANVYNASTSCFR